MALDLQLKNTYWFHASSGEIEYCKSVIRALKLKNPTAQVVVTYSSPSAEKLFHNIQGEVTQFIPLPWDEPYAIQQLIQYIQPRVLIFSRTDLWPELLTQAHKQNIPMGVISYHPAFGGIKNFFLQWQLNHLDFVSCLNENIKNKIILISDNPKITADGDTRFDQVFHRLEQPPRLRFLAPDFMVCGSTWPEDEKVLFEIFPSLRASGICIVLCPHDVHTENIKRMTNGVQAAGLSYSLLSDEQNLLEIQLQKDVFIIDQVGYLADAYRGARFAFVGGSFRQKVHSVMEALGCGLPVVVGPYFRNNPEAVRYLSRFVFSARDVSELKTAIEKVLSIEHKEVLRVKLENLNASEKVLKIINELV